MYRGYDTSIIFPNDSPASGCDWLLWKHKFGFVTIYNLTCICCWSSWNPSVPSNSFSFNCWLRLAVSACIWKYMIWSITLYTLASACIFSVLLPMHFLECWQGEFVKPSRASLVGDHFLYSCSLQSRRNFGKRVLSNFIMNILAAIFDFNGSRRLGRGINLYQGGSWHSWIRRGVGVGEWRFFCPPPTPTPAIHSNCKSKMAGRTTDHELFNVSLH